MVNKHRGEVSFEAGEVRWSLCFSADAIVSLEDEFDLPVGKIGELIANPDTMRMKDVRRIFIVGLRDRRSDMDEDKARDVFRSMRPVDAIRVVSEAFSLAFDIEEDASARPPPAGRDIPPATGGEWDWPKLLRAWCSLGLDPDSFWSKTPKEIVFILRAQNERLIREHNEHMSLAWHIAALMREQKLPRLDTMFIKPGAATKPHTQTPEERWRMFMAVSAGSAREHGR